MSPDLSAWWELSQSNTHIVLSQFILGLHLRILTAQTALLSRYDATSDTAAAIHSPTSNVLYAVRFGRPPIALGMTYNAGNGPQSSTSSSSSTPTPCATRFAIAIVTDASGIKCVFGGPFALWEGMRWEKSTLVQLILWGSISSGDHRLVQHSLATALFSSFLEPFIGVHHSTVKVP
jgi:hypothetical protein